jgi:hypothetical protein
LFGTFQEELEEVPVVYGTTSGLEMFTPVQVNVSPFEKLYSMISNAKDLKTKFLILWTGPGWNPETNSEYPIPPITPDTVRKYNPVMSTGLSIYILLQFLSMFVFQGFATGLLQKDTTLAMRYVWGVDILIIFSVQTLSMMCDRNRYSFLAEMARLFMLAAYASVGIYLSPTPELLFKKYIYIFGLFLVISVGLLSRYRNELRKPISAQEMAADLPGAQQAEDLQIQKAIALKKLKVL